MSCNHATDEFNLCVYRCDSSLKGMLPMNTKRTEFELADHLIYKCVGDNCECCSWPDEDYAAMRSMDIEKAEAIVDEHYNKPVDERCHVCDVRIKADEDDNWNGFTVQGVTWCNDCSEKDCRQKGLDMRELDYENHVDGGRYDLSDDAEALASAGWGTDEDYGYYGDD